MLCILPNACFLYLSWFCIICPIHFLKIWVVNKHSKRYFKVIKVFLLITPLIDQWIWGKQILFFHCLQTMPLYKNCISPGEEKVLYVQSKVYSYPDKVNFRLKWIIIKVIRWMLPSLSVTVRAVTGSFSRNVLSWSSASKKTQRELLVSV